MSVHLTSEGTLFSEGDGKRSGEQVTGEKGDGLLVTPAAEPGSRVEEMSDEHLIIVETEGEELKESREEDTCSSMKSQCGDTDERWSALRKQYCSECNSALFDVFDQDYNELTTLMQIPGALRYRTKIVALRRDVHLFDADYYPRVLLEFEMPETSEVPSSYLNAYPICVEILYHNEIVYPMMEQTSEDGGEESKEETKEKETGQSDAKPIRYLMVRPRVISNVSHCNILANGLVDPRIVIEEEELERHEHSDHECDKDDHHHHHDHPHDCHHHCDEHDGSLDHETEMAIADDANDPCESGNRFCFDDLRTSVESMYLLLSEPYIRLEHVMSVPDILQEWKTRSDPKYRGPKDDFYRAMPTEYSMFLRSKVEIKRAFIQKIRQNLADNIILHFRSEQEKTNAAHLSYIRPLFPELFFQSHLRRRDMITDSIRWDKLMDARFLSAFQRADQLDLPTELSSPMERGKVFIRELNNAVLCDSDAKSLSSKSPLFKEETEFVYSFPVLSHEFCSKLMTEIQNYERKDSESESLPKFRPNSMNRYGLVLNQIGLQPLMSSLTDRFFSRLAAWLLPSELSMSEQQSLDDHHSFTVEYRMGEDEMLDMHIDDSEVTINISLGDSFEGGNLAICGITGKLSSDIRSRIDPNGTKRRKLQTKYQHCRGRGILHAGRQRHGAMPITEGERCNLIVWMRSTRFREITGHGIGQRFCYEFDPQSEEDPDLVCLSHTHDSDYDQWVSAS